MPLPLKFFIAFATVLILIGATAWLVRRYGANRLGGSNTRGRQPRLAVIDVANVDQRRRLVLIRRDNVEHLLMIGGPSDVVVEPNIVRAAAGREGARSEPGLRSQNANDSGWPLQPINEPPAPVIPPPAVTPSPRTYRASATEEPWLAPEPGARPRPNESSSLSGLAAELSSRLQPPEPVAPPSPRQETRHEPPVRASASPPPMSAEPPSGSSQPDHNLAEMAQQLEAALRRSPMPEGRPPVTDPLAASLAAPEARSPARDFKSRMEPKFASKADKPSAEPRPAPRQEARLAPRLDAKPAQPLPGKSSYDNLEEEMANLLGRPPGKT